MSEDDRNMLTVQVNIVKELEYRELRFPGRGQFSKNLRIADEGCCLRSVIKYLTKRASELAAESDGTAHEGCLLYLTLSSSLPVACGRLAYDNGRRLGNLQSPIKKNAIFSMKLPIIIDYNRYCFDGLGKE